MTTQRMVRFRSALNPELCLDVRGGSTERGTVVQLWHVKGENKPLDSGDNWNLNQWWTFTNDGHLLSAMGGTLVLDAQGSSPLISENHIQSKDAVRIDTQKSQLTIDQIWKLRNFSYLRSSLSSDTTSLVVDVPNASTELRTQVQLWPQNSPPTANQLWEMKDGYLSSGLGKDLVLDVKEASAVSGTPVITFTKNHPQTPNQTWSDGGIRLRSDHHIVSALKEADSRLVLDVPNGATTPGTPLQVWKENFAFDGFGIDVGTANQRWSFSPTYCQISLGSSDLVLDVPEGAAKPEIPIQVFERNYPISPNQLWIMDVH